MGNGKDEIDYYGILTEVIELQYLDNNRVVLFRCKWFDVHDTNKGIKVDKYGFVSINLCRFLKGNDHFVLANQASQVFYMDHNYIKGWHVVTKTQPRDLYNFPFQKDDNIDDANQTFEISPQNASIPPKFQASNSMDIGDNVHWRRADMDPNGC